MTKIILLSSLVSLFIGSLAYAQKRQFLFWWFVGTLLCCPGIWWFAAWVGKMEPTSWFVNLLAIITTLGLIALIMFLSYGLRSKIKDDDKNLTRRVLIENSVKNLLVFAYLFGCYKLIFLPAMPKSEKLLGYILTISGLLAAGAIAGIFGFSYGQGISNSRRMRTLEHGTTFLLMLGLALLFGVAHACLVTLLEGTLSVMMLLCMAVVYSSVVLFDFWDLMRDR